MTRDCDPYMADVGVAYHISPVDSKKRHTVTTDFCNSHWVTGSFGVWSHSHQQFSSVVTWSQTVFGRSQP